MQLCGAGLGHLVGRQIFERVEVAGPEGSFEGEVAAVLFELIVGPDLAEVAESFSQVCLDGGVCGEPLVFELAEVPFAMAVCADGFSVLESSLAIGIVSR